MKILLKQKLPHDTGTGLKIHYKCVQFKFNILYYILLFYRFLYKTVNNLWHLILYERNEYTNLWYYNL